MSYSNSPLPLKARAIAMRLLVEDRLVRIRIITIQRCLPAVWKLLDQTIEQITWLGFGCGNITFSSSLGFNLSEIEIIYE